MPVHACDTAIDLLPVAGTIAPARAKRPGARQFAVEWARSQDDVREAQRLRYQVFCTEMGATLSPPHGAAEGLDADRFDPYCEHLLVRAIDSVTGRRGPVVGTYRLLSPSQARAAGGYYSDTEFDLAPLAALRPRAVELGRSCVHADWRLGGVILGMWSALADYMLRHGLDTMIGCASIGLADGPGAALALWERLRQTHLAQPEWRVRPLRPLPGATAHAQSVSSMHARTLPDAPPLIKGYLRCGAHVLGPPAHDAAFNTADLPMMLRLQDMSPLYRKHFLDAA
ncbi:GNAT family N-acyltransferase [Ramlibacter sp.]|uniref:GNAT family N-acetyltransferase n=1 Tax=Ramlibacter sp. TaxID=1917967 RepID=UPI0017A9040E|nr:GNAT family N-acyltransferase [Ramlibacter sp.]MBA2674201.1 GNAT family N-acetyltransferase [Ramlibacter sp.]